MLSNRIIETSTNNHTAHHKSRQKFNQMWDECVYI